MSQKNATGQVGMLLIKDVAMLFFMGRNDGYKCLGARTLELCVVMG